MTLLAEALTWAMLLLMVVVLAGGTAMVLGIWREYR